MTSCEVVLASVKRTFQSSKSRKRKKPQPKISEETIALIKQIALTNQTWGAERVRGELKKLGINVAKRTIQRHMKDVRPKGGGQTWATFLKNHNVWACDFLQLYDCWFRPIFAFFIVDVNTKKVLHVAVTRSPSETWTVQQLHEVTPFTIAFGDSALTRLRADRLPPCRGPRSGAVHAGPRPSAARVAGRSSATKQRGDEVAVNAVCERFLRSSRRECLDHVLILNERHLEGVLKEYAFSYFNKARPHQGIAQRVPIASKRESCLPGAQVIALPVLGGVHHDYRVAA